MNKLKVFLAVLFFGAFSLIGAQYLMNFDYGNITSDGSGNISASAININNAFRIRANTTAPTLVQNVNNTAVTSSSLTGNDAVMQLTYTCSASAQPATSNYFTITLAGAATSTNPLIVIPCTNTTTNGVGNTTVANATLNRLLVTASSNSFILSAGASIPNASVTHGLAIQVFRQ